LLPPLAESFIIMKSPARTHSTQWPLTLVWLRQIAIARAKLAESPSSFSPRQRPMPIGQFSLTEEESDPENVLPSSPKTEVTVLAKKALARNAYKSQLLAK